MKKILFSFALMAFCFLIFPGMTVFAAKSYEAPDGELYANYYYYKCTYQNQYYEWKFWTDVRIASFQGHFIFLFPFGRDFRQLHTNGGAFNGLGRHYITCNGSTDNFPEMSFYIPGASQWRDDGTFYDTNMPVFSDQSTWQSYLKGEYDLPVTPDSGTYDPEIGYLQDLEKNFRFLKVDPWNDDVDPRDVNRIFHFGWASSTSSGYDLTQKNDGVDIKIQVKFAPEAIVKNLFGKVVSTYPADYSSLIDYPELVDASLLSIRFGISELSLVVFQDFFDHINEEKGFFNSIEWKFSTFLRPIVFDGSEWRYGGWSRITFDQYVNSDIDSNESFDVYVSGGDIDPSSGLWNPQTDTSFNQTTIGEGTTIDDSWNSSYYKDLYGSDPSYPVDNFFEIVTSFSADLGQLPSLMASLFSFLPSYIPTILGLGVTLVVILRVLGR